MKNPDTRIAGTGTGVAPAERERALTRLLAYLTFGLVFVLLTRTPQDADMWWHLRAGEVMWEQKTILTEDPFSFTRAGEPWTNAFWLSEILFYLIYRAGDFFALSLFTALIGAATFAIIFRRLNGNPFLNSAVVLLGALTAAPIWSPRPQILSFLLLAWLDGHLASWQRGAVRRPWIVPIVFAIWANVHGGWIWGLLLLLAHFGGLIIQRALETVTPVDQAMFRRGIGWFALSALAICLNPNGLSLWRLPFHTVDVSLQIQEWLSPDFHRLDFHPFLWMIFLLLIAGHIAKLAPDWPALLKITGFAYLTFFSQRSIAPFAIVAAPVLAHWANEALAAYKSPTARKSSASDLPPRATTVINAILLGLIALVGVLRALSLSAPTKMEEAVPAGAVEWIQDNAPAGNMLNSYNWGGYLIWALPDYPVYIDGRADLYGDELIGEWREIVNGSQDGLAALDDRGINMVLLEPGWPLLTQLPVRGWTLAYEDETSVIFVR